MKRQVISRPEMKSASLTFGATSIPLADYETTGLVALAMAPRGHGKTNAGLVIAEQLSRQGWVCVLVDPEEDLEGLYGNGMADAEDLERHLIARDLPIVVVNAPGAEAFVPYGEAILRVGDRLRKPLFVMVDEGQMFSTSRPRKGSGRDSLDATGIIRAIGERGRKRAIDIMVTAHRLTASLDRSLFSNKNLTLVGAQEDPASWKTISPHFRAAGVRYEDANALRPGEFFCLSRRGTEKVRMPVAAALAAVAPRAVSSAPRLPKNFAQWTRALDGIPTDRLVSLTDEVVDLLASVAGLSPEAVANGQAALDDELASRGAGG